MIVDVAADGLRHEVADGSAGQHALADRRGRDLEMGSVEEHESIRSARELSGQPLRCGSGPIAARARPRAGTGPAGARGSCQVGSPRSASVERMNVNDVPGEARSSNSATVSTEKDGPGRSSSIRLSSNAGLPRIASSVIAARSSARLRGSPALWGGEAAGMKSTRSRPRTSRASSALARWPTWMGSNVPPRIPIEPGTMGAGLATPLAAPLPDAVNRPPRVRAPIRARPPRCGRDRRPRPPRGAAPARCRGGRGRAGSASPTPR